MNCCRWSWIWRADSDDELGFSLETVAQANLDKLASRAQRQVIGGSGDQR